MGAYFSVTRPPGFPDLTGANSDLRSLRSSSAAYKICIASQAHGINQYANKDSAIVGDNSDPMRAREDYSTSLLSRSTIPSSLGSNAASPPSSGPGLKTGVSFASGFRSGTVTQDRLFPGLGPRSIGLEAWEAVNRSNYEERRKTENR